MMRKVLLKSQRPIQLVIAMFGALAGVFMLLFSVQVYLDLSEALNNREDLLGADYLVIQKQISTLDTFNPESLGFTENEIDELSEEPFVEEVGIFESSRFQVFAAITGLPGAREIYTEAYFEAVPDRFLDVVPTTWTWSESSSDVPVILPGAYLDAFNFGFGPSQGLPPLTEKAFKLLTLKIRINGVSNVTMTGKIVGFSDRINTILVPIDFLRYANLNYQNRETGRPNRLILAVTDLSHPGIVRMMENKGYDTNQENLKGSRVKTILLVVLFLILFVGAVIIILSVLTFIQYVQILISRVNYELRVLLLMGYDHSRLARRYIGYVAVWLLIIFGLAAALLFWAEYELLKYLNEYELSTQPGISWIVWVTAAGLLCFYLIMNAWSIRLNLRRLAKTLQG